MPFLTAVKHLAIISYGTRTGTTPDYQQIWGLRAPNAVAAMPVYGNAALCWHPCVCGPDVRADP